MSLAVSVRDYNLKDKKPELHIPKIRSDNSKGKQPSIVLDSLAVLQQNRDKFVSSSLERNSNDNFILGPSKLQSDKQSQKSSQNIILHRKQKTSEEESSSVCSNIDEHSGCPAPQVILKKQFSGQTPNRQIRIAPSFKGLKNIEEKQSATKSILS